VFSCVHGVNAFKSLVVCLCLENFFVVFWDSLFVKVKRKDCFAFVSMYFNAFWIVKIASKISGSEINHLQTAA